MTLLTPDILVDEYVRWFRANSNAVLAQAIQAQGVIQVTLPFVDRHNDLLQVYARQRENDIRISDYGYIIQDVRNEGFDIDSEVRKGIIESALNGLGVKREEDELVVESDMSGIGLKLNSLAQAMLAVSDLSYTADYRVQAMFFDMVKTWLKVEIPSFGENVSLRGRSGVPRKFHFRIPSVSNRPVFYLHALARPTRNAADNLLLRWLDTETVREPGSRGIAVVNDMDEAPERGVREELANYNIRTVDWKQAPSPRALVAA